MSRQRSKVEATELTQTGGTLTGALIATCVNWRPIKPTCRVLACASAEFDAAKTTGTGPLIPGFCQVPGRLP